LRTHFSIQGTGIVISWQVILFLTYLLDRNNTNDICHILGNVSISQYSKKQVGVELSIINGELVAISSFGSQVFWMRQYNG